MEDISTKDLLQKWYKLNRKMHGPNLTYVIQENDIKFLIGVTQNNEYSFELVFDVFNVEWNSKELDYIINNIFENYLEDLLGE